MEAGKGQEAHVAGCQATSPSSRWTTMCRETPISGLGHECLAWQI